ncbi:MAG: branched-chain amino acid aminotransferase [Rhodopirellula sp.]|nr:branched-chain amino acid aminotransferase [Rhodopirellula sp.]
MNNIFTNLINDENGFIVSAELILVATIAVLGLVVGLSEIAFNINNELEDVGAAFGSINQSFYVNGIHSAGKGCKAGSSYSDESDTCDSQYDIVGSGALPE